MTIQLMKQNSTSKCFLLEKGTCSNFKVIFLDMYILQIRPFAIRRPPLSRVLVLRAFLGNLPETTAKIYPLSRVTWEHACGPLMHLSGEAGVNTTPSKKGHATRL